MYFFFSSRRRHTRFDCDWSSDVCSSDLRHGLFASYEAFAMVSASKTVQHAKWLQEADRLPWRAPVASLNILLTSTSWRQDHNGFSHQGPGLIDVVLSKKGTVSRIYLPPDANCLLSVAD